MKLKICFMAALCLFFKVQAQQKSIYSGLQVGDKVPDVTISNIINYPGGSARVSDFKNKLLILDFWATWCSSCIAHFPEMYAIQNDFRDDVFILLVSQKKNRDSETGIKEFFKKRSAIYRFNCAVQDTVLEKLFPHKTIPHYAVIKNNKVLAITDGENINAKNIRLLIADNDVKLYLKKDLKVNPSLPLFTDGNGGAMPDEFFRSIFTDHIGVGVPPFGFTFDEHGMICKITAVNVASPSLFTFAYPEYAHFNSTRILLSFPINKLNSLFKDSSGNSNFLSRPYTYEGIFPAVSKVEALRIMREDLERYYHLKIDSQYRDTTCLVLRLNTKHPPSKVNEHLKKETNICENIPIPKFSHGLPPVSIIYDLESALGLPCFDETGFSEPVSVDLPADLSDIKALTVSLKKQGFILTEEKRKVSYMVFLPSQNMP